MPTYDVTGKCYSHDANSRLLPTILLSLIPSRHPTRPICAHPPHILSPASHTITHLTSLSPLPPPKSPPSSHFTGTQQDVTHLLFRGRKRVRVASYVSIGRSFFPLSTSSTSLHIDYPPRTRYLFLSSPRTNALPLTPHFVGVG